VAAGLDVGEGSLKTGIRVTVIDVKIDAMRDLSCLAMTTSE
jgi:hypothetical protein